jgi:hypothetical protein
MVGTVPRDVIAAVIEYVQLCPCKLITVVVAMPEA